jgi:hypothetical protein
VLRVRSVSFVKLADACKSCFLLSFLSLRQRGTREATRISLLIRKFIVKFDFSSDFILIFTQLFPAPVCLLWGLETCGVHFKDSLRYIKFRSGAKVRAAAEYRDAKSVARSAVLHVVPERSQGQRGSPGDDDGVDGGEAALRVLRQPPVARHQRRHRHVRRRRVQVDALAAPPRRHPQPLGDSPVSHTHCYHTWK